MSLVFAVKNAMPQLRQAMDALQRQTYRNFEVIVQDGASTDGTVEYLNSLSALPRIDIVSEPDSGVGQAYNRALARSKGDLVCFSAADECLDEDALAKGVRWFLKHPDAVVVFGGVRLIDAAGRLFQTFIPPPFDWMQVLHNETAVPMSATFVNRNRVAADLYFDESITTCPDYDFWLRLGSKIGSKHEASQFVRVAEPIATARADRTSSSFRAESFPHFTKEKLFVLNRFLGEGKDVAALKSTASAGILTWAAENLLRLEGVSPEFLKCCREAARFDPHSARLSELTRTSQAFQISSSGIFELKPPPQPQAPVGPMQPLDGLLRLEETHTNTWWTGAAVERGTTIRVTTASEPWSYSALIPFSSGNPLQTDLWYWARLNVQVLSGEIGIGLFAADNIYNEQTITPEHGRVDVFVRMNQPQAAGVMIRTGSRHGPAVLEIFEATVACAPRTVTLPRSE